MAIKRHPQHSSTTSWESVGKWYHGLVGEEGHYYHRHIIMPGVIKLLEHPTRLLDLACGNGILTRYLSDQVSYLGIDSSTSLIKAAKKDDANPLHTYIIGDITKPLNVPYHDFSHATLILAAQNIEYPYHAFQKAQRHLLSQGKLVIVLNHPCFRIPRQSSWGVDTERKIHYRRIDRYLTSMKIPISAHPSQGQQSSQTLSFHHPLSAYSQWLYEAGFTIELMEEWTSDKTSTGKAAAMENRSRQEIPLFLAIRAVKR
jgi:ubiquinone/menaquinone biosynthesis C-methylase UbiE